MALALITGGTSGIGLAFARTLAAEGHDLILVARDSARLATTATRLNAEFGVQVDTLTADLTSRGEQARVAARLRAGDVGVLINNAGFSLKTPLVDGDEDLADRAYEVMGRAPRVLASAAASAMLKREPDADGVRGRILTTASVSAWTRQDSYSALKAYVLALTEVLAGEIDGQGVTVTAVMPGWTRTEFHDAAKQGRKGIPDQIWLDPQRVADEAWADAKRGRVLSIPTRRYKAMATALHLLPTSTVRWISRIIRRRRVAKPQGGTR